MKIYTQTFDLAQPMSKMISVAQNSDFGIGIKIVKNGVAVEDEFTVAVDGEALTPEADKISGFTIYILNSGDVDKTYTVTCKGQSFKLTQNTTESSVFDLKPASEPAEKYGISLDNFLGDVDANGVLQAPTDTSIEFVSDEIQSIQNAATLNFLKGSKQLTKIDLPNLTTVGNEALATVFQNCTALAEVNLPSLSSIGGYGMVLVFSGCSALTQVSLQSLATITAEGELNQTFKGCTQLEYASIPNLVSAAAGGLMSTFQGCTSLKYLDLSKLSRLAEQGADSMCNGCTALQYVDFRNATAVLHNIPTGSNGAKQIIFANTNDTFKVIVPDALYDSWIADNFWSNMASQIVKASDYPVIMTQYGGQDNMDNI